MPTSITINDGSTDLTFTRGVDVKDGHQFRGPIGAGGMGAAPLLITSHVETDKATKDRFVVKMTDSVTVNGVQQSVTSYATVNFTLPMELSATARARVRTLLKNLLVNVGVIAQTDNGIDIAV